VGGPWEAQTDCEIPERCTEAIPSWDLSLVLQSLQRDLALMIAQTSVKGVGNLQALPANSCLEFGATYSNVVWRPWPGYVPKVQSSHYSLQRSSCELVINPS